MGTKKNPGLLPRALDVIFNSTHNYMSDSKVKPCMHSLVQKYTDNEEENRDVLEDINATCFSGSQSSPDLWDSYQIPSNRDDTTVPIDEHFEYGIWVSFAEIYTEKIYDLLVKPDRHSKRKALSLKYEYSSGHKYIYGLKEVKVKSIQEAYAILFEGQKNRAEYSTITNHTSSRSHSIFTIRIVRVPIDEDNYIIEDPAYATVSKFSIVDLAGSERYRNTLNSGQRLKEAGNINKSLMVLGQCMETLRLNQLKSAIGKRNAMVPYRHSKLTELFKSSFEGDGKAVMVVNVNPFDTGFDENSHVMKFAAVAKDVATWRRVHPKLELRDISTFVNKRLRTNAKDKKIYHGIQELMEEDLEVQEDEDDDEGDNEDPFVDNLIYQIEELRNKYIESETSKATMESEIRMKVAKDAENDLKKMEEIHMTSLKNWNDVTEAQTSQIAAEGLESSEVVSRLQAMQTFISKEMETMRNRLNNHEVTEHSLLQKIAELEKDKQRQQESITQMRQILKERDNSIEALSKRQPEDSNDSNEMEIDNPFMVQTKDISDVKTIRQCAEKPRNTTFDTFLELRKKLRRSIFREDEYSHDADVIMCDIEQFNNVSFDLVKETNMGKLMKLITQREFKNDPYGIKNRAKALFKSYAKLSIPVLAPIRHKHGRGSMIAVSVNAGREEELILDMRNAMSSLQEENLKLKHKIKHMNEGQRRLQEAFEKAKEHDALDAALPFSSKLSSSPTVNMLETESEQLGEEDLDMVELFSPILGATPVKATDGMEIGDEDRLTLVEGQQLYPEQPARIKKRRKLEETTEEN
ncbi:unnamed protein product [Mucor hiemalis]